MNFGFWLCWGLHIFGHFVLGLLEFRFSGFWILLFSDVLVAQVADLGVD